MKMAGGKLLYRLDIPHGSGPTHFTWQSGSSGSHLVTTGSDGTVAIYNRQGQLQDRIVLQALCTGFSWDSEGDILGIITNSSSQIILWDINTRQKQIVDTGLRDPLSCLLWSKSSQILAVGSTRGNLAIYNHQTTKRTPILGKHSKRITCGAWSKDNILALGSDDKTFSLSSEDGDSLRVIQLRDVPSDMCFAEIKTDERLPGENTISMIIGRKTLYLYHLPEPDSPAELGFQHKYGSLLQHKWFGDGYILLGFSQGNVVAISTHPKEVGQELWQIRNHRDSLSAIAVSRSLEQIASCGDDKIKIHSISNLQETVNILTVPDQSGIKAMDWSVDGQLIAATTSQGSVYVFVTKLSVLSAVSFPRIAILSSLAEVSIYNYTLDKLREAFCVMPLEIEPSVIAVGPFHFACAMNNHAWFYGLNKLNDDLPILLSDREYIAEITNMKLNDKFCAALIGGRLSLHLITNTSDANHKQTKLFPENTIGMQGSVVTSILLTTDFLIFSNDLGHLVFFSLEFWSTVITYRHTMGIRSIYSDTDGTKIAFIDDHNEGYIFSPSDEEPLMIHNFPKNCSKVLWDSLRTRTFVVFENKMCVTYVYTKYSIDNKQAVKICDTPVLSDQIPLLLYDNDLCLATSDGSLSSIVLTSHLNLPSAEPEDQLNTFIQMRKFNHAWQLCRTIDRQEQWNILGRAALADLDIYFAMKVYRHMGKAAIVFALKTIASIEDINFVSAFCALLLGEIDKAKTFFTKSVCPKEALDLCRDLLEWEQAIALADTLAPEQIPLIAREYAHQLEFTGRYGEALSNYEKGMETMSLEKVAIDENTKVEHLRSCTFGIARTKVKIGNGKEGISIAMEMNDKQLFQDCAEALLDMNETAEAARLFELAENWDQACQLYVQLKAWHKVHSILPNVTNSKMHALYAKSCEIDCNFNDAIEHYRNAGDMDSVVRIYVENLSDPHSAAEIVLETRSIDGSKMLAKFYQNVGDVEQALRFLILCGCVNDAFGLAKVHNKLRQYAELLEHSDSAQPSNFLSVAEYFENEKYTLLAGKYYYFAKEYAKAMKHLLKASTFSMDENIALSLATDCAASSNDDKIANQLIEFLLGEHDGSPKDPKYLFGLYMARKQFREAAKTAVIMSNQEQMAGNYRNAHDLLFSMYQEQRKNNLPISAVMLNSLALLHRYTLVRTHVKIGDHAQAAKLLVQVAANISRFPAHTVPILTSTVIECQRVGFQKAAFSNASILMRAEYRSQIDQKYSKKIEAIVRKAPNGIKDAEDVYRDETQPCPVCDHQLYIMELTCNQCKTNLPMCIATGQHIAKENLAACPICDFLCFKPQMSKILNATNQCPMCSEIVDSNQLNDIQNVSEYLNIS